MKKIKNSFKNNGYTIIKSNSVKIMKKNIEKEILDILKSILKIKGLKFKKRNYSD